uniref:G-protein coupled receptors family 1 profile domain-containing protein n=1 Tax=Branchiostoma floridae TaxID=7739 RepID=C3YFF6_BRAFL|eukprot:XP_002604909.1 hypothetical protein BRAFLDRAFT_77242 [Branchiostoma floridae]
MENVTNVSLNHGDSSEEDYADLDDIYAATEHSVPWAFQVGTAVVYAVVLLGCGTNNACRLARACRQPPRKRHIVEANLRMADFLLVVFGVPLIFQYHTVTPFAWYWGSAVCTAYTYGKAVLQGVASHLFLVLEIDSMGFFVGQPNQPSLRNITSGKEGCATRHKTGNVIPSSDDVETVQVQLKRVRRLEH